MNKKIDELHEMLIDLQMYITVSGIPDEEAIYLEERINEIRNKVFELETNREERCIHCGDVLTDTNNTKYDVVCDECGGYLSK